MSALSFIQLAAQGGTAWDGQGGYRWFGLDNRWSEVPAPQLLQLLFIKHYRLTDLENSVCCGIIQNNKTISL